MWQKLLRSFIALAALIPVACGQASGDPPGPAKYPFSLSQAEIDFARSLAEKDLPPAEHQSGYRTLFIKVDLLPDSQAETSKRLVMVHQYQYPHDQTILTMIDLRAKEVLKREILEHYPTALAPVEVEEAIGLARGDVRLGPLVNLKPTHFDARPIQYAVPGEPLFGHRVVHLLMRHGGDYLVNPQVFVDLTTRTVHLEVNTQIPH